jgi:hypothetical protein
MSMRSEAVSNYDRTVFPSFVLDHLRPLVCTRHQFVVNGSLSITVMHIHSPKHGLSKPQLAQMAAWLSMVHSWMPARRNCLPHRRLTVWLAWTDLKKQVSKRLSALSLKEQHVNTAYTYACPSTADTSQMVIYRREEWFKVFIHETFHTFGLDCDHAADRDSSRRYVQQWIQRQYGLHLTTFRLAEMYTETWARLWNVVLVSAITDQPLAPSLHRERQFALDQADRVMHITGLSNPANKYTEHGVNVFAYYVLTAALLRHWDQWIEWCVRNNAHNDRRHPTHPSAFTGTDIRPLCAFVAQQYPQLERFGTDRHNAAGPHTTVSLRMTIVEANL